MFPLLPSRVSRTHVVRRERWSVDAADRTADAIRERSIAGIAGSDCHDCEQTPRKETMVCEQVNANDRARELLRARFRSSKVARTGRRLEWRRVTRGSFVSWSAGEYVCQIVDN